MQTFIQLAADNKHAGGGQAVRDHLDNRALVSQLAAGVDGDQHEAHVRYRGVSNKALDVGLRERHPGAVEDADHAQPHGDWRELVRSLREQRQAETQQAVGRGFQQDARQVDGTCGWRLAVRIRQPAVQRHHRHFHREGDEEAQHQHILHVMGHRRLQQVFVIEGPHAGGVVVHEHQAQDRNQHHQTAGLGVDEELGRRGDAGFTVRRLVTPQRDQEVHRHQHHFPEEEEQEHVDGEEHADNAAQDPQQVEVEEALILLDFTPGTEDRQHAQQTGQHHHQQRQTVQRQVDGDAEARDPRQQEFALPLRNAFRRGQCIAALHPQLQRERQRQPHCDQRYPARHLSTEALKLPAQQTADKGDKN